MKWDKLTLRKKFENENNEVVVGKVQKYAGDPFPEKSINPNYIEWLEEKVLVHLNKE